MGEDVTSRFLLCSCDVAVEVEAPAPSLQTSASQCSGQPVETLLHCSCISSQPGSPSPRLPVIPCAMPAGGLRKRAQHTVEIGSKSHFTGPTGVLNHGRAHFSLPSTGGESLPALWARLSTGDPNPCAAQYENRENQTARWVPFPRHTSAPTPAGFLCWLVRCFVHDP